MNPVQDQQTVTPEGVSTIPLLAGVRVIPLVTHLDARGGLTQFPPELFELPVIDGHQVTIRPGKVKGWIVHYLQLDRLIFWQGDLRVVLHDDREDSPTRGRLNDLVFGESKPVLCFIPPGVYHAVQNLGSATASHLSFPTVPYNHARPDKHRLPLDTPRIPFDFTKLGW